MVNVHRIKGDVRECIDRNQDVRLAEAPEATE